jgi:hypothetical protein
MMKEPGAPVLWTITYRLLVPVSLFLMTSSVDLPETKSWMKQSLFLYAIHFIIVRFVNKGTAMMLVKRIAAEVIPQTMGSGLALLTYFAIPVIVLVVSYPTARFLSRWVRPVWSVLSGGRNL